MLKISARQLGMCGLVHIWLLELVLKLLWTYIYTIKEQVCSKSFLP